MISPKFASIYLKIAQAQNYAAQYEETQRKAMALLTRLFTNPEEVWQKALNTYQGWQKSKKPEYDKDDIYNMAQAAFMVLDKVQLYAKKKEDPKNLFEIGIPRTKSEKSRQTKESYTWDITRSKKPFDPSEVVGAYDIQSIHDAIQWCENNKRTIDSLAILLEALGKGGEQGNYTQEAGWRDEQSVANYINWLTKAGKWHPETDHFTQMAKELRPQLVQYKKEMLGL